MKTVKSTSVQRLGAIGYRYSGICLLAMCASFLTATAQRVLDPSELNYPSSRGRVELTPDYSEYAIYFEKGTSEESLVKGKSAALSLISAKRLMGVKGLPVVESEIPASNKKRFIKIKGGDEMATIGTKEERSLFLKETGFSSLGATDIQPLYKKNNAKVQLTHRCVIKLADGLTLANVQSTLDDFDARFIKTTIRENILIIELEEIGSQFDLIHALEAKGQIAWGEPDFISENVKHSTDPLYPFQFHLENTGSTNVAGISLTAGVDVDAEKAWKIATGAGVKVAVMDDGVNNHPDLATLLPGTSSGGGDGTSYDLEGHGMSCAGLIGAQHNDIGIKGIAPSSDIMSINVYSRNASSEGHAEAILHAVNAGTDVISTSLWMAHSSVLEEAFEYAANEGRGGKGCVIMVASGNVYDDPIEFPADLPYVTTVGAISGVSGQRASYSGHGPELNIMAPSGLVVSTDLPGSIGYSDGDYTYDFGGTSAATPIVAGVAALVLSENAALTRTQVQQILYESATDYGDTGWDEDFGHGLVNAHKALVEAGGSNDSSSPSRPGAISVSNRSFSEATLSWNASSDNTGVLGYEILLNGTPVAYTSETTYQLRGLEASTRYVVRISAYDGAGNTSRTRGKVVRTVSGSMNCVSVTDSYSYIESFETGDGWSQPTGSDDGNWKRNDGGTSTSRTGPSNASNGEYYMYLEASSSGIGKNASAILESDCFDLSTLSNPFLSLDYHMYGVNIGDLELNVLASTTWETLWSMEGNQGNEWKTIEIDLSAYRNATIQLQIVGTTGNGVRSDIAIDNFLIGETCTERTFNTEAFERASYDIDGPWGIWNDGGSDCTRSFDTRNVGWAKDDYAIRLRDNSSTSVLTTESLDLRSFGDIQIKFRYYPTGMESGEGFVVEYSTNGGSSYQIAGGWYLGSPFENDERTWGNTSIPGPFTSNTKIRFRGTGSNNGDMVYLDEIEVSHCAALSELASSGREVDEVAESTLEPVLSSIDLSVYPNPTSDVLHISGLQKGAVGQLYSQSGQVLYQGELGATLDLSHLNKGIYYLQVQSNEQVETFRVVKN